MEELVWSADGEEYVYSNKYEAVEALSSDHCKELLLGMTVCSGVGYQPDVTRLVDSSDIIDMLGERAYDQYGEWAEDFPDVSKEAEKELNDFLRAWVEKNCAVNFYNVKDTKEWKITEEDLLDIE